MNQFVDRILRWLRWHKILPHIKDGDVVCDIGCGPHAEFLNNVSKKIEKGIGLDKRIKSQTDGNIEIKKVVLDDKLPIESSFVDKVTMLAVLEHLEDHITILEEARRVLKNDGEILITVPTYYNKPVGEFLAFRLGVIEAEQYLDHKRYYNKRELKRDLERAGLEVLNLEYWELGMNLFARAKKNA